MGITNLSGLEVAGVPTMGMAGAPLFSGNWYFVDYVNGNDGNPGSADEPLKTIYAAHDLMQAGNNDVCVIVGNGAASGTQRLSIANAQVGDPTATTGTLNWSKDACHLIGMTAPTGISPRARLAPETTATLTTFGSGTLVNVTASGCYFANFQAFSGYATGGNNQICWNDSGDRNYYADVHFAGAGDTASAQSTSSRSLVLDGGSESTFVNCTFGVDTVQKTVANSIVEFKAGSTRNKFVNCDFIWWSNSATTLVVSAAAASAIDRWIKFDNCAFLGFGTALTGIASLAASVGGYLLMKNSTLVSGSATNWGADATSLAQMWVDGGAPTANATGIAVNPS
jgi:hypothetical protein